MANYYLDTEFTKFGGELISLALVREDGESIYLVYELSDDTEIDPWVSDNVLPIVWSIPSPLPGMAYKINQIEGARQGARLIANFLAGDTHPMIISDWPDDIAYFCKAVITGPGEMASIPRLAFQVIRVDAYPTDVEGAVRHNSYWDALALRRRITL